MIENYIEQLNRDRNVRFSHVPETTDEFHGKVSIGTESLELRISFNNHFPMEFPFFYLENSKRFYPHVDKDNKLCLFENSSLLINSVDPYIILLDAFDRAVEILSIEPGSTQYTSEILKEFNAYWGERSLLQLHMVTPKYTFNSFELLDSVCINHKIVLSDNKELSLSILDSYFNERTDSPYIIKTYFIKLSKFVSIPIKDVYTWKWLRLFILQNTTSSQKAKFKKILKNKYKTFRIFIILMIPGMKRDIPVGFSINRKGNSYKILEKVNDSKVKPLSIKMIDYEYMTLKTGTPSNLKDKRVLLLGCGSVGGYVAANLCQSGLCCIDILDKDILYVENVHRHILGFSDALKEKNKADLMSNYLEDHYPFAEIDPMNCVNRDVRELLKTPERLKNYDLIVSALGEPTINLEINKLLIEQKISVPFVVCFNEPYGIGGHAIAVNVTQGGCLRCLYSDILSGELISFSTSFVKEGQNFSKTISGCAGTYVEYSSLDTQQTALLTSRLCISVLKGETNTSTLLSWYGNSITLENNGFAVSDYYKACISSSKYNGIVQKSFEPIEVCPVCKMKHQQ
ncbi:ThiF family adenylyltransferase [Ruminococcus albus]|uniref:UBA/THIF-type NAD/FAD binding protein n=1 Tax=Ruminococcus albus (strain ATCC 27210 / DSM 20455 / JCM 14654 / NCDO 2250 / 7) TaxID=697329 RepID=E6UJP1_RUMA7|nr:ThiF family adenylyltransferase [Ruminococcus albus]ADU23887.1 UBA/THIF-type NAD/FAD binding protein [Ruminococcus albus 7 = DSM 20455]